MVAPPRVCPRPPPRPAPRPGRWCVSAALGSSHECVRDTRALSPRPTPEPPRPRPRRTAQPSGREEEEEKLRVHRRHVPTRQLLSSTAPCDVDDALLVVQIPSGTHPKSEAVIGCGRGSAYSAPEKIRSASRSSLFGAWRITGWVV